MTVAEALRQAAARLAAAGIDDPRLEARMLAAAALGVEPAQVFSQPERPLDAAEAARFEALVQRRSRREPMSHILGRRGFWTLELAVTADTLDPRPDTETVIEAVLAELPDRMRPLRLLDFGTGTGAILLALLSELPAAQGMGVDLSPAALAVAQGNADRLGFAGRASFRQGDWGKGIDGCFDVIVSNPPYIPDGEIAGLAPEVAAFEPRGALAGGPDGLACYRALVPHMARLLAPGGIAALEVGQGQAETVASLLVSCGLAVRAIRRDLGGIERCVVAGRGSAKGPRKRLG